MNKREKMLIGAVAVVVVLFFGRMFYKSYADGLKKLDNDIAKSKKERNEVDVKLVMAQKAVDRLAVWREQSLPNKSEKPNDPQAQDHAFSVYSQWLGETVESVSLKPGKIDANPNTQSISQAIRTIGVSIETNGSMENLVEFLYKFYSTPQLHQISRIELRPVANSATGDLMIKLQAEALMLPGATSTKVPVEGKLNPFKLADVGEYRVQIGRRDIFKPYKKPSPVVAQTERPSAEAALDDSNFARFTGATGGSKGMVAWIYLMNKGDQMIVSEGDNVNVGRLLKSKVVSIEQRFLTLDKTDGSRIRVEIGGYLKDGKSVPKPAPPKPTAETEKTPAEGEGEVNAASPESVDAF